MILGSIAEISLSVQKFSSFILAQKIKNLLYYYNFTVVFVKMCKRRKRGGFSQSQSHIINIIIKFHSQKHWKGAWLNLIAQHLELHCFL